MGTPFPCFFAAAAIELNRKVVVYRLISVKLGDEG